MPHNRMSRELFVTVTGDVTWASVDEIVARLDQIDFWSEGFIETSLDERKKAWVRREIKSLKDDENFPLFASITRRDPETGDEQRLYKQELMFDRDDYAHVVDYHRGREQHHHDMATGYAKRAERRFGVQLYFAAD